MGPIARPKSEEGAPIVLEYGRPPSSSSRRGKGLLALFASVFVLAGLGQFIAGRRARGVTWLVATLALSGAVLGLALWPSALPVAGVLLMIGTVAQVAMYVDAYLCGRRSERRMLGSPLKRYGVAALCLVAGAFVNPAYWLATAYRTNLVEAFNVPGNSMAPAIVSDDRILVHKRLPVRRWDVVAFNMPPMRGLPVGPRYVKRLVGLPGETVEIKRGQLFVDGRVMTPPAGVGPYTDRSPYGSGVPNAGEGNPLRLGADEYFFLGDNSPVSADSRYWSETFEGHQAGTIPGSEIIGRVTFRYWPPGRVGAVR